MITKFHLFESLRDKMIPKSDKEIEMAFGDLSDVQLLSEVSKKIYPEAKEVAKKLKTPMTELYLIEDRFVSFDIIYLYVTQFVNINGNDDFVESIDDDDYIGGIWECFIKEKIAMWFPSDEYDKCKIIIFPKNILNLKESLKDKKLAFE